MNEINRPEIVAEVLQAFQRYEKALMANDVATLNELFWNAPHTIRFGLAEQAYGHAAIAGVRAARDPKDLRRELTRTVITTYGKDFATASCEYRRIESGKFGRRCRPGCARPRAGAWSPPTSACSIRSCLPISLPPAERCCGCSPAACSAPSRTSPA